MTTEVSQAGSLCYELCYGHRVQRGEPVDPKEAYKPGPYFGCLLGPVAIVVNECPGHGRGGGGEPCCDRAGEYNGFASGSLTFVCPKSCACHD